MCASCYNSGARTLRETLGLPPLRPKCQMCGTYHDVDRYGKYRLCDECVLDLDDYEDFLFELRYQEAELEKSKI